MPALRMTWAIPLAGVTVLSTLAGGVVALRLARELATAIALTGRLLGLPRPAARALPRDLRRPAVHVLRLP